MRSVDEVVLELRLDAGEGVEYRENFIGEKKTKNPIIAFLG
jgi:hypothetical protein